MTGKIAAIVGGALVLIVAGVVAMRTLVLPQRAVDLAAFSHRVGSPGATTGSFSERSIIGALAYGLASVTTGRVDDFWARTDEGTAQGTVTLHVRGRGAQVVSVEVVDTARSDDGGLAACQAGPRCRVTTLPDGATLAIAARRHPTVVAAVLTDPARHLHLDVQASGNLLTEDQLAAVADATWWANGAPRNIATASRWLKVRHIATSIAVTSTAAATRA